MDEQTQSGIPEPAPEAPAAHGETILVVDDDEDLRGTVRRTLQRAGYKVMEAATPDSALRLVKMSNVDMVVIDVILPMMSGLTLAEAIVAIRPRIRMMYMSGYTNEEVIREVSDEREGTGFISKPFTPDELVSRVRSLLDEPMQARATPEPTPGGDETILVVDDDADFRRNVVRMLERLGYRVLQAQDPDHALRIALQSKVHLILMDVVLPRLDGATLANTISSLRPKTRILYMSGYARAELEKAHDLQAPPTLFLAKPFGLDELGRKVRSVLEDAGATRPAPPAGEL